MNHTLTFFLLLLARSTCTVTEHTKKEKVCWIQQFKFSSPENKNLDFGSVKLKGRFSLAMIVGLNYVLIFSHAPSRGKYTPSLL